MADHGRVKRAKFFISISVLFLSLAAMFMASGCGGGGGGGNGGAKISGTLTVGGIGLEGVTMTLSGDSSRETKTGPNGSFSFGDLSDGNYIVTPSLPGFSFSPKSQEAHIFGIEDAPGFDFSGMGSGKIAAANHTVFLKQAADGSVTMFAWGSNSNGQLGDGTTTDSSIPIPVIGLPDAKITPAVSVAAGSAHTVAVLKDGTVWAWGSNSNGQLGNNSIIDSSTPVQVKDQAGVALSGVTAIAAGNAHTVAMKSDGTVFAWGANASGQLGDGTATESLVPVQVMADASLTTKLTGVTAVAAGNAHTVALMSDGTVRTWGSNIDGQLGVDPATTPGSLSFTPVQVTGLTGVTAISAGSAHNLALRSDGTVSAWGSNSNGQLGDGSTTDTFTPIQVKASENVALTGVIAVSAGSLHSVILKSDNTVFAWGSNSSGQLGNNTTADNPFPVQVITAPQTGLKGILVVTAGTTHSVALKNDTAAHQLSLQAWGDNVFGQLGDGTNANSSTPVPVSLTFP